MPKRDRSSSVGDRSNVGPAKAVTGIDRKRSGDSYNCRSATVIIHDLRRQRRLIDCG
jgi:hypothetical protein